MSIRRGIFAFIAGSWLLTHAVVVTAEPVQLVHNPFSRPPSASTTSSSDGTARRSQMPQVLDLRATMVASNTRLADVAGQILRPGDELNGYRLLHVFEDRAVFHIEGKRLTIYVKPELGRDAQ